MVKVCILRRDLHHPIAFSCTSTLISMVKVSTTFSDLHRIARIPSPDFLQTFTGLPAGYDIFLHNLRESSNLERNSLQISEIILRLFSKPDTVDIRFD